MNENDLNKIIKEVKEKSKKRNFVQSIDISINTKQIDLKKPENKFTEEIRLQKGRGKNIKVAVIGDSLIIKSKDLADGLINEKELTKLENDKKELKKTLNKYDCFIAEAPFMVRIGKNLGRFMAPRGKMPKPLPPQADPAPLIKLLKNTTRATLKNNSAIHCAIGTEAMKDEDIIINLNTVIQAIEKKLPNGKDNIKSIYIKTTMGAPIKINY
ncbi:MAG: 50S ribosomal protein L1 [archaeon]